MAFFLTPRFAPAYKPQSCSPFGSCAPVSRPSYRRVVARPSFPSFAPFLSQVDDLLSELDREARRAQHAQRQQRKRAFRARFDVRENGEGYEVEGEVPGFEQENISIEVTDDHTVKIAGNTENQTQAQAPAAETETSSQAATKDVEMDGVTLNEAHATTEPVPERAASPAHSETSSQKSYQAFVEDDFEDLGAETSSTISESSTPAEPKGKGKAVEEPTNTETAVQPAPHAEAPTADEPQHREWLNERVHGSFERTFRFPERIDAAGVRAALKNGVLSIAIPKAPAHQVRQISIQ